MVYQHRTLDENMYFRTTRTDISIVPPLAQLLPAHHRLRDDDRKRQCSDREHELRFVEALAQHVKCARGRDTRGEEVEPVCEDEGCGLEERWAGDDLACARDLENNAQRR